MFRDPDGRLDWSRQSISRFYPFFGFFCSCPDLDHKSLVSVDQFETSQLSQVNYLKVSCLPQKHLVVLVLHTLSHSLLLTLPILITFLYPHTHTLQLTESETLGCQSLLSVTLSHLIICLYHFPLPLRTLLPPTLAIRTNIPCSPQKTLHHASLNHWPNGLFARSFASRSKPRPVDLLRCTRCCTSCPYQTGHRWPCTAHVRSSGPYNRPR